jgi:MATE family multidrug resistance protein
VLMRQIAAIGAPISIAFLLEYGLFSSAGLLMGLISTTALAAHQIALQITAILFMVPFGISMAATVRVGHAVGRNDAAAVKRAGLVAMLLSVALSAALTLAVIIARVAVVRFFLDATTANADATIELATMLLAIGATLFITDGLQATAVGALRGLKDTRVPLLFAAISYWAIGFSAAYALAFFTPFGAIGVWIGLSVGTAVYAMLLILRFLRLANRFAQA